MRHVFGRLTSFTLILLLGACASTPPSTTSHQPSPSWQQHQASVNTVDSWGLSARVTVNAKDKGWSGKLHWQQQADEYQIQFNAPLGQGAFRLSGNVHGVEMQTSDGDSYQAADAETLIYQQLGWRFPLAGLRYWVMGVPDPGTRPLLVFDQAGHLVSMQQAHWKIRYPDYIQVEGLSLPKKVYLDNTELKVRLVIDRWELQNGA